MKRAIPALLGTTLALVSAAGIGAERVYKWTDADGVVHFSASPPPEGPVERVTLPAYTPPTPPPAPEATEPATRPEGPLYAEAEAPDNTAVEEANRKKKCDKGRNMLAQIEPRPRVYRFDEDGNQVYLSDQERLDLLDEARQLVAENCAGGNQG